MTTASVLEKAINEDPTSDARRLVYADFLTEQGDPRGELISLQVAMSSGRKQPGSRERIVALVDQCWDGMVADVLAAGVQRFCIRRGFVDALAVDASHLDELDELTKNLPITELRWTGRRDGAVALTQSRALLNVSTLDLSDVGLGATRFAKVLRSNYLANLTRLVLSGNQLGEAAASQLGRATGQLPCLEFLDVRRNRLGADGIDALASGPLGSQLVELTVDEEDVTEDARARIERAGCALGFREWPDDSADVWFPALG